MSFSYPYLKDLISSIEKKEKTFDLGGTVYRLPRITLSWEEAWKVDGKALHGDYLRVAEDLKQAYERTQKKEILKDNSNG